MKTSVFFMLCTIGMAFLAPALYAATPLKMSVSHTDQVVRDFDGSYVLKLNGSLSLSGSIPLQSADRTTYFDSAYFNQDTVIIISANGFELFDHFLGDIRGYKQGSHSITAAENGVRVSLSWAGSMLTLAVTANTDLLATDLWLGNAAGTTMITNRPVRVTVATTMWGRGASSFSRDVYLNGQGTVSRVTKAGQDFLLANVKASGSVDSTAPTLSFADPTPFMTLTNGDYVTVQGQAKDNIGVATVEYCVSRQPALNGSEEFLLADLTDSGGWSALFTPQGGTNYFFVRATDAGGNCSTTLRRAFYYQQFSTLTLDVTGDGTVVGLTNGQVLEVGRWYSAHAVPQAGQIVTWEIDNSFGNQTNLSFQMWEDSYLKATFTPNPYGAIKGTYTGLLYGDNHTVINPTNAGCCTLTVTGDGAFSGKITFLSGSRSVSGRLAYTPEGSGTAYAIFSPTGKGTPSVSGWLTLPFDGSGLLTGTIFQRFPLPAGPVPVLTFRSQVDGKLVCQSAQDVPQLFNLNAGDRFHDCTGYGTARAATNGTVKMSLTMAGFNSPITLGTTLTADYAIPFFAPHSGGKGLVMGWLGREDPASGDWGLTARDALSIVPVTGSQTSSFPLGFKTEMTFHGGPYIPPGPGTNVLGWTQCSVSLGGDNPEGESAYADFIYSPGNNRFTVSGDNPNKIRLWLDLPTGQVSGSFIPTGGRQPVAFKGLFVPIQQAAQGFFHASYGYDWFFLSGF